MIWPSRETPEAGTVPLLDAHPALVGPDFTPAQRPTAGPLPAVLAVGSLVDFGLPDDTHAPGPRSGSLLDAGLAMSTGKSMSPSSSHCARRGAWGDVAAMLTIVTAPSCTADPDRRQELPHHRIAIWTSDLVGRSPTTPPSESTEPSMLDAVPAAGGGGESGQCRRDVRVFVVDESLLMAVARGRRVARSLVELSD